MLGEPLHHCTKRFEIAPKSIQHCLLFEDDVVELVEQTLLKQQLSLQLRNG